MKTGAIAFSHNSWGRMITAVMLSLSLLAGFTACGGKSNAPARRIVKKKVKKTAAAPLKTREESSLSSDLYASGYVYQRRDRRDPFIPLIMPTSQKQKEEIGRGTLESYDISEFKLTAIARRNSTYFALLVTPDNRAFTVRRGMRIGLNKGKVKEVSRNRVVLVEYARDYRGELKPRQITLEFNKGEDN
jgi:type IV pilus assembly protein PilP